MPAAHPSIARVNDAWLEGSHHDDTDSDYANRIAVCAPHIPYLVRATRALTGRMVRYLLDQGVRQFVDLGSGIPTMGQVHEVAKSVDPSARVIYTDADPSVVTVGGAIVEDEENVAYLAADIRRPDQILSAAEFRDVIDLNEPVALLAIETLLYLPDAEDPAELVGTYLEALSPGSYFGLVHCGENAELRAGMGVFRHLYSEPPPDVTLRDPEQLKVFFSGLELIDPGITTVTLWNPLTEEDAGQNPELAHIYAGLGQKH